MATEEKMPEETMHAKPKARRRRHGPPFSYYDLREIARTLMFLAGLAGLVMGDIWLAGKL